MPGFLHLPQSTLDYLINKYVKPSIAGYQTEMNIFIAENLAMGISSAKKTKLIGDTLRDVDYYGSKGSLYEAYDALERVKITPEMAPFLTEERKEYLKNRLISILSSL